MSVSVQVQTVHSLIAMKSRGAGEAHGFQE